MSTWTAARLTALPTFQPMPVNPTSSGGQQDGLALVADLPAVFHMPAVDVRGPPLGVAAGLRVGAVAAGDDDLGAVQPGVERLQLVDERIVYQNVVVARLPRTPAP